MKEDQALALLKKHSPDERVYNIVLNHSRAVQTAAMRIAKQIQTNNQPIDIETIRIGSLLHDIGRFKCPPGPDSIKHGITGAAILREENTENLEPYAQICERHLGAGITKEDIREQKLPLPEQDFIPLTIEEKVITYADNLIAGSIEKDIDYVIKRYRAEIGENAAKRVIQLHNEIEKLKGTNNFL